MQNGTRKLKGAAMAAQFKANAAKVMEESTAEVRLPIPSIAPDFVFEFIGRRVDINSMLIAGELPDSFARKVLDSKREDMPIDDDVRLQRAIEEAAQMSAAEKQENIDFQRKIALKVCVSPKLQFSEAKSDDEIDLREIPFSGDLIVALFQWAMNLSPEVPVKTADGGETTIQAVENFSPEKSPENVSGIDPASASIRAGAV